MEREEIKVDYVFPEWAVNIMKAPSQRTQMESSLVGLTIMMLGSLGVAIFMIASGIVSGFWFIALICLSEAGLLSFQFSMISTTYQTYYSYKLEMGMYPLDYKLDLKIKEAKLLKDELDSIITQIELNKTGGEKC